MDPFLHSAYFTNLMHDGTNLDDKVIGQSSPISPQVESTKEQNIGNYGYIGTWILRKYRKYRKISVDILTKISIMQKLTKIF